MLALLWRPYESPSGIQSEWVIVIGSLPSPYASCCVADRPLATAPSWNVSGASLLCLVLIPQSPGLSSGMRRASALYSCADASVLNVPSRNHTDLRAKPIPSIKHIFVPKPLIIALCDPLILSVAGSLPCCKATVRMSALSFNTCFLLNAGLKASALVHIRPLHHPSPFPNKPIKTTSREQENNSPFQKRNPLPLSLFSITQTPPLLSSQQPLPRPRILERGLRSPLLTQHAVEDDDVFVGHGTCELGECGGVG